MTSYFPDRDSWVDEDLLAQQRSSKQKQKSIFWVTELTSPCLRFVFFDRKLRRQPPIETLRVYNSGNILELFWIDLLRRRKDVSILRTHMPCRHVNPFYRVHGSLDVLIQYNYGRIEAHEIKSVRNFGSWLKSPLSPHVYQLQFYLNILGINNGYIDYINKLAFTEGREIIDQRFQIERDPDAHNILLRKAHELYGTLMADILPTKEKCWKCGNCFYYRECENE